MKDPTYFKRVKISPSASIKMMSHCQSGVDKGIKNNGNPVEVMGFLLGHPDSEDPHAFIISDAQVRL
jgi:COP9 signalosome complex subunit 5